MSDSPIIIGLSGQAGTGKTSVAEGIVPKGRLNIENSNFIWDHIFFALPLYELASIRTTVRGLRQKERQLYAIHNVVYDLYGGSPIGDIPDYDDLVELVYDIYSLPIEYDIKPRSFLQQAGDLCRNLDPDCFANWAIRKAKKMHQEYLNGLSEDAEKLPFIVIISDVRFMNEAKAIKSTDNSILINFMASEGVRHERLFGRDGYLMSDEQKSHSSENEMHLVQEISDVIIDTDNMNVDQQVKNTIDFIKGVLYSYA